MNDVQSGSDLERQAVELANGGKYSEARALFERVLETKAVPLHRAQVLRNIMFTYDKEGNKVRAMEIAEDILNVPGLCDTNEGVFLHGQITGHIDKTQGRSIWMSKSLSAVFAAYSAGAAWGAALGSKAQGSGITLFGQTVTQDLRYGGAAMGALLGLFVFARITASAGPVLSLLSGLVCTAFTAYMLLSEDFLLGLSILGILVTTPIFLMLAISKNR